MSPIVERNAAPRRHPGAELETRFVKDPETLSNDATVRLIKGRGLVATITPHFAVALIVGLVTAFVARKQDPVSDDVGNETRRCSEGLTQLRADFTQFKAEQSLHNLADESKLNELLARTWSGRAGQPSVEPSGLGAGVSRELSK